MPIAQIISLAVLAAQTVSQMIAEGRTETTAEEATALQAAIVAQAAAEDEFEKNRNA